MRRNVKIFGVLLSVLFLSFSTISTSQAKEFKVKPINVTAAAGSIGGSWFIISTAFFSLFEDNIDGLSYSIVPGGGVANPIAVHRKQAHFGMGYTTNLWAAYNSEDPYKEEMKNLRGIANINVASVMHPWILKGTGITSLKNLAEKKFPVKLDTGTRGTGGELAASRTLEIEGASYADIRSWGGGITHSSYSEAIDRMKDGHIQMFMNDDIVGHPLFVELSSARDVVLLPISEKAVEELAEKYGYTPAVVPAGTYRGQDQDVKQIAQHHVFFCDKDLPEDLVYAMTKLIFTNKERLVSAHKMFSNLDAAAGFKDFPIPLHPGAERFYREVGAIK